MLTIIDYGMGNLRSVSKAFEAVGCGVRVSRELSDIRGADRIVLPGVGSFADGMKKLGDGGLIEPLTEQVLGQGKPFLGICLGMQLLARQGHENGLHAGLSWVPADVLRIQPNDVDLKVPHIGWNDVTPVPSSTIFRGLGETACFYFIHSYHMICDSPDLVEGTFGYGGTFTAAIRYNNIFGTQFHPEKSQKDGLQVLRNFLDWTG